MIFGARLTKRRASAAFNFMIFGARLTKRRAKRSQGIGGISLTKN